MNKKHMLLLILSITLITVITSYAFYVYAPSIQNPKVVREVKQYLNEQIEDTREVTVIDQINSNGLIVYIVEIKELDSYSYAFVRKQQVGLKVYYDVLTVVNDKGEYVVGSIDHRVWIAGLKTDHGVHSLRLFLKSSVRTQLRYVDVDIRGQIYYFYYADKGLANLPFVEAEFLD